MLFMKSFEFSFFADFFVRTFKTREEHAFLSNLPVEGTVNTMEKKTQVLCKTVVQEFHLMAVLSDKSKKEGDVFAFVKIKI